MKWQSPSDKGPILTQWGNSHCGEWGELAQSNLAGHTAPSRRDTSPVQHCATMVCKWIKAGGGDKSSYLWHANCLNYVSLPQNAAHNHSNYTWQSLIIAFHFNQFILKYSLCARFQLIFPIYVSQEFAIFLCEDQSGEMTGWHATFLGGANF